MLLCGNRQFLLPGEILGPTHWLPNIVEEILLFEMSLQLTWISVVVVCLAQIWPSVTKKLHIFLSFSVAINTSFLPLIFKVFLSNCYQLHHIGLSLSWPGFWYDLALFGKSSKSIASSILLPSTVTDFLCALGHVTHLVSVYPSAKWEGSGIYFTCLLGMWDWKVSFLYSAFSCGLVTVWKR